MSKRLKTKNVFPSSRQNTSRQKAKTQENSCALSKTNQPKHFNQSFLISNYGFGDGLLYHKCFTHLHVLIAYLYRIHTGGNFW